MAQKCPTGLGAAGRRLWRDTSGVYELRADELLLLDKACRTADDLARLEQEMAGESLTTIGSAGQVRAHPLLAELRGMRLVLAKLLGQLDLPEEQADGVVRTATSQRKRDAALVRWHGRRGA